jgi:CheY-like chemotaxis protein
MEIIHLLVVEDDKNQAEAYQDTVDTFNRRKTFRIELNLKRSYKEAMSALFDPKFDGAVIDLKLSGTNEIEGLEIVREIEGKIRIPVIIYSGNVNQIDDLKENFLLRKRDRLATPFSSILNELVDVYETGITNLLRPGGLIDELLCKVFWKHFAISLPNDAPISSRNSIGRYIVMHLQEYLGLDSSGDFEPYLPAEVYMKPSPRASIHTGDILKIAEENLLVLTPACDMEVRSATNEFGEKIRKRRAEKVLVAKLIDFDFQNLCKNRKGNPDRSKLKSLIENGSNQFHYLPPHLNENGFLIDFQDLRTIEVESNFAAFASISAPFLKDVISRFTSYYSRQGQPTFGQEKLVEGFWAKIDKL